MASETSSVLEMEDADMEALSSEGDAPLMMHQSHDIAVRVDAPVKQLSTLETFVSYRVRCVCARWPPAPPVRRRYNHFKLLHKRLCASAGWLPVPPPPPLHTPRQQLDRYSPAFVAVRTRALNAFLDRLVKHPIFTHSEDLKIFLTTPDDEFEKIFKSENSVLNLWGLSSALYGGSENKTVANGARVSDPEWTAHLEYLNSLEQKLNTLYTLTNKLYKGTVAVANERANLSRVCSVWSGVEGGAAGGAAAALSGAPPPAPPPPAELRARLPSLAAYTAAVAAALRNRQHAHAAYVADPNPTGELHNKLEQASEALRSELADWLPRTRTEVQSLLLDTAEGQVAHYARILSYWESARARLDPLPVFETVSRAAAIQLSPSKYSNLGENSSSEVIAGENSVGECGTGDNSACEAFTGEYNADESIQSGTRKNNGENGGLSGENNAKSDKSATGEHSASENSGSEKQSELAESFSLLNGASKESKDKSRSNELTDSTSALEPVDLPSDPLRDFSDIDLS